MPYIKRISSIVNGADACGAGMKKSGIVSTMGLARIPKRILKSRTAQSVPKFVLTCCSTRNGSYTGAPQFSWRNGVN